MSYARQVPASSSRSKKARNTWMALREVIINVAA
jgi:hypothetical protein